MRRADFHYDLPETLIAQQPPAERTDSRLLCLDGESGETSDRVFADLPDLLTPGDLLVFNRTRVIPARLFARKATGGRVEILIERIVGTNRALAQLRASKTPRPGATLQCEGGASVELRARDGALWSIAFDRPAAEYLETHGHVPLPPYIDRRDESFDRERYQTVYADRPGAVAAPTAGLHFDRALLDRLAGRGIASTFVTLHVGAGTFQPVRSDNLDEHRMHAERLIVDADTRTAVAAARARGGRVVAVGTTCVRALESSVDADGQIATGERETRLFIRPGFRFRAVDAMITNFHLPESTLLMLVCAFAGHGRVLRAYRHAVSSGYRFFSYGDAMFVTRGPDAV